MLYFTLKKNIIKFSNKKKYPFSFFKKISLPTVFKGNFSLAPSLRENVNIFPSPCDIALKLCSDWLGKDRNKIDLKNVNSFILKSLKHIFSKNFA